MNSAIQRVVFDLLGERIGQPREAAHAHAEVLPLDVAGGDVLG